MLAWPPNLTVAEFVHQALARHGSETYGRRTTMILIVVQVLRTKRTGLTKTGLADLTGGARELAALIHKHTQ
jgi:hypothetical protein